MNEEQLPPDVRVKLVSLRQRRDERKALVNAAYASIRDCEARCQRLGNLIRTAFSDESKKEYAAKLEAGRDEHEQIAALRIRRDEEMRSAANDCNRVEDWLLQVGGSMRLRVLPKRKAERIAERREAVRADIAKLQSELQRIENSPLDRESQKANRAKHIDAVLAGFYVEDSTYQTKLCTRTGTLRELTLLEALWWRYPEQRGELLDRLVPEVPDGMTAEAKAEARERIGARLLSAERLDEALIEADEAAGVFVMRRPNADVRAVLNVALVAASEAEPKAA